MTYNLPTFAFTFGFEVDFCFPILAAVSNMVRSRSREAMLGQTIIHFGGGASELQLLLTH